MITMETVDYALRTDTFAHTVEAEIGDLLIGVMGAETSWLAEGLGARGS